ncbi:Adhesion G-protein coupled receptor D1 [Trichoplax sp. H2]|nr:Adhesion G-protein coupled receptor D1 [Trichoplax sp. H2]|eukprot:RDD41457.1 Adhesion G-protein coupled receptor D1 [Trichoplax sp. H2]
MKWLQVGLLTIVILDLFLYSQGLPPGFCFCDSHIAGVHFNLLMTPSSPSLKILNRNCNRLQNFSTIRNDIEGITSVKCTKKCVLNPHELNICDCRSRKIVHFVNALKNQSSTSLATLIDHLQKLHIATVQFLRKLPRIGTNLNINSKYFTDGLEVAFQHLNKNFKDVDMLDLIASCALEIIDETSTYPFCDQQDKITLSMIKNETSNYLNGRPLLCCQTGLNVDSEGCPELQNEAANCKLNLEQVGSNTIIWRETYPNHTAIAECSQYFDSTVNGDVSRLCRLAHRNTYQWSPTYTCHCFSVLVAKVQERLTRSYAKNYSINYLNVMASFLHEHQGDTPGKNLTITSLQIIYDITLARKETNDTEGYGNLTNCLLRTSAAILKQDISHTGTTCPIQKMQHNWLSQAFYHLAVLSIGQLTTERLLGPASQFNYTSRNYSLLILNELHQHNNSCVEIGAAVPPASKNDTITYNSSINVLGTGTGNGTNGDEIVLFYIGIVGFSLSLFGSLIMMVLYAGLRISLFPKAFININLLCAIIASYLAFTITTNIKYENGCSSIILTLQYLFTTIFTWQLCEGICLYLKTITLTRYRDEAKKSMFRILLNSWYNLCTVVHDWSNARMFLCYLFIGWALPAGICVVTYFAWPMAYLDTLSGQVCWLPSTYIWLFLTPLAIILLINLTILSSAIYKMHNSLARRQESERYASATNFQSHQAHLPRLSRQLQPITLTTFKDLRNAILLLPLLGLCWFPALFLPIKNDQVADYIFTILVSLQGFQVFLFHGVLDRQISVNFRERKFRPNLIGRFLKNLLPKHQHFGSSATSRYRSGVISTSRDFVFNSEFDLDCQHMGIANPNSQI